MGRLPGSMYEGVEDPETDPPTLSAEEARRRRLEELKRLVDEDPDDEE